VEKNDLEALKAAFRGVKSTATRLQAMDAAVEAAEHATVEQPPSELVRVATAHALAAAAFSGLLHKLFTPGGVAPKSPEITDSSGESAT
jgi:predicted nucleotidyltransferase